MPTATANGITIEYETFGSAADPAVLLIMGLGAQLTRWDVPFCELLAGAGFYVIRFDNRDVGLSTWLDDETAATPYTLVDMADDAAALLDALDIGAAHIVGASMGGMIAQTFAISHPDKTLTLTSIMSTTGNTSVGQPQPDALAALMQPPPTSREEAIEVGAKIYRLIGSPGYPPDEQALRAEVAANYDRAFHPQGTARQLAAIMSQPDRTEALGRLSVPTLVIHGEDDPLVTPSGGKATAAAVPGSQLLLFAGMGHDVPPELFDEFTDALTKHFHQV